MNNKKRFVQAIILSILLGYTHQFQSKEYKIDLNASPSTRYNEIIRDYLSTFRGFVKEINEMIRADIKFSLIRAFNTVIVKNYKEYTEEIMGIAKASNIPAINIFLMNCILEIATLCTSIVAQDPQNRVFLARNLDFILPEYLHKIQHTTIYMKNNKEIFRCGAIAGYIGAFTCMKPRAFDISLNARHLMNQTDMVKYLLRGKPLTTWMLRETMVKANNYDEAVKMISRAITVSGGYVSVSGVKKNEGCIITRGRDKVANIRKLSENTWYILQCNNDPWNATDVRSIWGNKEMIKLGRQNVNLNNLAYKILRKSPLLRPDTIETVLMSPSEDYFKIIPGNKSYNNDLA